jgi:hypothetical protein
MVVRRMPMDGRADICSCNICTSTIRGGRMSQAAMDGGATMPAQTTGVRVKLVSDPSVKT